MGKPCKNCEILKADIAFLLEEYHYLCRQTTLINNIIQPLWGEIRARQYGTQTIEQALIERRKEAE